jgi:nitrite reductase/ring-hydroxylating ferredoxin subunit
VIADTCSHLSGPLHQGELTDADGDNPCVTCPWHGSIFSLTTGDVVHGPATAPQPKFETLVRDGMVEVLLVGAG